MCVVGDCARLAIDSSSLRLAILPLRHTADPFARAMDERGMGAAREECKEGGECAQSGDAMD